MEENERVHGSSNGQSMHRSSSRKSYGEIMAEVYIANGSYHSNRS